MPGQVCSPVHGKVTRAIAKVDPMAARLYFNLAEPAIPVFVLRIIADHVIGRAVFNPVTQRIVDVVTVVVSLTAGLVRNVQHSSVRLEELLGLLSFRLHGESSQGTPSLTRDIAGDV